MRGGGDGGQGETVISARTSDVLLRLTGIDVEERDADRVSRRLNLAIFVLSLTGIGLVILGLEVGWDGKAMKPRAATTAIKSLITLTTVILLYFVYRYHRFQATQLRRRWCNVLGGEAVSLLSAPVVLPFATEMLVCALHAPPFLDFEVVRSGERKPFLSDKFGLMCYLRLYILARVLRDFNRVYQKRTQWFMSKPGRRPVHAHPVERWAFSVKFIFQHFPWTVVSIFTVLLFSCCTHGVYVSEREKFSDFTAEDAAWFTFATTTTAGYGDITVQHDLSRFFAVIAAIGGITFTSVLTGLVATWLTLRPQEEAAVTWSQRRGMDRRINHGAARVIQAVCRLWVAQHRPASTDATRRRLRRHLFFAIFELRRLREEHVREDEDDAVMGVPEAAVPEGRRRTRRRANTANVTNMTHLTDMSHVADMTDVLNVSGGSAVGAGPDPWHHAGALSPSPRPGRGRAASGVASNAAAIAALTAKVDEIILSQQLLLAKLSEAEVRHHSAAANGGGASAQNDGIM